MCLLALNTKFEQASHLAVCPQEILGEWEKLHPTQLSVIGIHHTHTRAILRHLSVLSVQRSSYAWHHSLLSDSYKPSTTSQQLTSCKPFFWCPLPQEYLRPFPSRSAVFVAVFAHSFTRTMWKTVPPFFKSGFYLLKNISSNFLSDMSLSPLFLSDHA